MHELSLAQSIIEIAVAEASKRPAVAVKTIKLRLGEFTGVVREALEFSFEVAKRGTPAEFAALEIEAVKLKTLCPRCGLVDCPMEDFCLICSRCGDPVEILAGREMQVEYVDLVEAGDVLQPATTSLTEER
ncbi:MAG TPA: hydrogenase maturation nickel metallochaperone HypA [Terriglobia bacterium]|nr:hydrogenase maturation nickel metallochaperone HypA [Terriglobia bacterium]